MVDFEGKLNPIDYCNWIASLEAFFEWKDFSDAQKGSICSNKMEGSCSDLVATITREIVTEEAFLESIHGQR